MRTSLLIFVGFAVLAVILAAKPKKNSRDVDASEQKGAKEETAPADEKKSDSADKSGKGKETQKDKGNATSPKDEDNVEEASSKSKKKSKSPPAKQPKKQVKDKEEEEEESDGEVEIATPKSKKNSKSPATKKSKKAAKEEQEEDSEDEEDFEDLLNDDDEEEEEEEEDDDEVRIPDAEELTTNSDPIELAKTIKNLDDKNQQKELINDLRELLKENEDIFPGVFYRAALAALKNKKGAEKAAQKFWDKQIAKAAQKLANAGKKSVGEIGSGIDNARKIIRADPLGIAMRRGEAVFLTVLSDALKNVGKLSDFVHDSVGNVSKFVRAATFPVDAIPFASDIKNDIHNYIEEQAERGKFLHGAFAENGSEALARAAKSASKKADERENLLSRQFFSKRTLL